MSTLELADGELIQQALSMWANHIETATIEFSAIDAEAAKKPFKALSLDQMKLVIRLRELAAQMGS
jgi:hypothetical protein